MRRAHSKHYVGKLYVVAALGDRPPVGLKRRLIVGHLITIGYEDAGGILVEVLAEPVLILVHLFLLQAEVRQDAVEDGALQVDDAVRSTL